MNDGSSNLSSSRPTRSGRLGTHILAACWLSAITFGAAGVFLTSCTNPGTAPSPTLAVDPLAAELDRRLTNDIRPLLQTYCFDCHGGQRVKGDIRLDTLLTLHDATNAADMLTKVAEMVRTKEMPPPEKASIPKPSDHERLILTQWLESAIAYVPPDAKPDPGWFTIHRLNRSEYRNTLRDLLGINPRELDIAEKLPHDDTGYGFDNNADVLTISPLSLEQYLDAAEKAVEFSLGPVVEISSTPHVLNLKSVGGGHIDSTSGVFLTSTGAAQSKFKFSATGEYLIRINAYETKGGDEHANLSLRIDGKTIQDFPISGSKSDPQDVEVKVRIEAGTRNIAAHFANDYYEAGVADRNLGINSISIAGPLDEATTERKPTWKTIFGPDGNKDDNARAAAIISAFATQAYRRPLDPRERESLENLYRSQRDQGLNFESAVRVSLTAILTSPNFLYRSLNNPSSTKEDVTYHLSGYELASRLSYFLWSSMPDEPLLNAAHDGSLTKPDVLRAQVHRMIADPRSDAFIQNFTGQWLQLRTLNTLAIDKTRFPQYDDKLRADMVSEATLYFGDVVRSGGSILTLLNSDYTFLNDRLASFYGIEGVEGPDFRRVTLSESSHRGGVLTMSGVLTVTSNTTRTSPVKRGFFVLDQFLGTPPPPPPADVPPLEQASAALNPNATLRQRLAAHVANPSCAVCHNRLDPIGLAFENFDAIGRWRDEENGSPIDASGTLPGGVHLNSAADLKAELLSRGDQFVETLSGKVLTYAIGRGMEPFDRPAIRKIANETRLHGNRFDAMIEAVVLSDTFRTCRGRKQTHE